MAIKYEWRTTSAPALVAAAAHEARAAKCERLHLDFDEKLRSFYSDACGFKETTAGLIAL